MLSAPPSAPLAQAMVLRMMLVHGSRFASMRQDVTASKRTALAAAPAPELSAIRHTRRRAARNLAIPRNWSASTARETAIFGRASAGEMPAVSAARR